MSFGRFKRRKCTCFVWNVSFHTAACQNVSIKWCRCGLEKVNMQHHKHPARPQRVHQQQAITSVCYLSHSAAQDLIRGSLQHTKQGTPKQAGNSREKLPGSRSISRKGFGNLWVELQATNVRATACFLSQPPVGRTTKKIPQIPGRCWKNDGKGTFKEEVVVQNSFNFTFSSLADEGEQRSAGFKLGRDKPTSLTNSSYATSSANSLVLN